MSNVENLVNGIQNHANPSPIAPPAFDPAALQAMIAQAVAQAVAANPAQPTKGRKAKAEKPVVSIPAALKGHEWKAGESSKGTEYKECSFPGSDWKLRIYTKSGSVCLAHGRSLVFADGAIALAQLAKSFPAGHAFLLASVEE